MMIMINVTDECCQKHCYCCSTFVGKTAPVIGTPALTIGGIEFKTERNERKKDTHTKKKQYPKVKFDSVSIKRNGLISSVLKELLFSFL